MTSRPMRPLVRARFPAIVAGLWTVGCSGAPPAQSGAATTPVVVVSDPAAATHFITLGDDGPTIGFSDHGGGYINWVDLGTGNICEPRYGRGWQSAIRDWLHWGRYNPTQGGFNATAGAPAELAIDSNAFGGARLTVKPFNLPLFADPVFDFTEHEDLVADWPGYQDGDTSDTDGLDESGWTEDDELRSEFDFASTYEDVSAMVDHLAPVMRQVLSYTYVRPPRAIRQFGPGARQLDGSPVIRELARVTDISPQAIGGPQRARDVDLGLVVFVTQELRVVWEAGFRTVMWLDDGGEWRHEPVRAGRSNYVYVGLMDDQNLDVLDNPAALPIGPNRWTSRTQHDLVLLSNGEHPDSAVAIALYAPHASPLNARPVVGVDPATHAVLYEEDRRMRHYAQVARVANTNDDPGFAQLGLYLNLTGLIAPDSVNATRVEVLRQEVYVLFGTPNQIRAAAEMIGRRY